MATPTPDEELDAVAGELAPELKDLDEARRLAANYRGTENDYRLLAEEQEVKLPELRQKIRAKLARITPSPPPPQPAPQHIE